MSLEAIKKISDAEQWARALRSDTQTQVRRIKSESEEEGRALLERSLNLALAENKRLMKEAEGKAALISRDMMERSDLECRALKEQASARIDDAVRFILERIVVT